MRAQPKVKKRAKVKILCKTPLTEVGFRISHPTEWFGFAEPSTVSHSICYGSSLIDIDIDF